jgi:hypothetical protein
LANGNGRRRVEFSSFFLKGVESVETEELVHDIDGGGVELVAESLALESIVEVLDNKILGVRGAETPEVDEKGVPGILFGVAVLESFKR